MSKLRQSDSNGHHTQSIFVSIHITGDQHVQVDSHGGRGLGSNIAVLADHIAVYVYDVRALGTYADAWTEGGYIANHCLPEQADPLPNHQPYAPGVILRAHGRDEVTHTYDPFREQMALRIGQMRWLIHDRQAYRSMTDAWQHAKGIGGVVLATPERRLPVTPVQPATVHRGARCDPALQ